MSLTKTKSELLSYLKVASNTTCCCNRHAVEFLSVFFDFVAICRQNFEVPREVFAFEERTMLLWGLERIIPKLDLEVSCASHWHYEKLIRYRKIRSGIEFITNEIIHFEESLKERWENFLGSEGMEELNEMLDHFDGMTAEYFDSMSAEDLRHVPEEHNWWTEDERQCSKDKFGIYYKNTEKEVASSSSLQKFFKKLKRVLCDR